MKPTLNRSLMVHEKMNHAGNNRISLLLSVLLVIKTHSQSNPRFTQPKVACPSGQFDQRELGQLAFDKVDTEVFASRSTKLQPSVRLVWPSGTAAWPEGWYLTDPGSNLRSRVIHQWRLLPSFKSRSMQEVYKKKCRVTVSETS